MNADLRRIAERDLASLTVALAAEETKSALVLAGSVIEAILTDLLEARSPAWIDGKKSFFQIIEMCGPKGLRVLDERTVKVADTVRDTRNFVHPGRERETLQGRDFARSEGIVAQALVEQVIEAVAAAAATRP